MDRQRTYDALLIKAFRQDKTVGQLWFWLRGLGIEIPDKTLLRQPPTSKMRVQTFVGLYLKPLADKLWDTDRSKDIETLNWMAKLQCQKTGKDDSAELKRKSRLDRQRQGLIHEGLMQTQATNQWHVTKANIRMKRVKLK
jgi:hypothetical protein